MTVSGNAFVEQIRISLLRGGRMTKFKGKVASLAPGMIAGLTANPQADQATGFGASLTAMAGRLKAQLGASVSTMAVACAVAGPMALTATSAHAGTCTETPAGSGAFVCLGPAGADVTQNLTPPGGGALDVSTDPGFGITTAAGDAINLSNAVGDGGITFTDLNMSAITGGSDGIDARNYSAGLTSITTTGVVTGTTGRGIFARNTGTSLTIDAQGAVSGSLRGIRAENNGSGALSITSQAVTGTSRSGIIAFNSGTSLTIDAQGAVSGATYGIGAFNNATGALSITSQAVTGTADWGIYAYNRGTSLTINAQGTVSDGTDGITARNLGSGALSITSQAVTGTTGRGINAINDFTGTSLSIDAQDTVSGVSYGIYAFNIGRGALSITSQAVTGIANVGIGAGNFGTSLTIDAQGVVSGDYIGIFAGNSGRGALSITSQAVTGTTGYGIIATNSAVGTSLTIDAQGAVSGGIDGIRANNQGTAGLTITAGADVRGNGGDGIYAYNSANDVTASMLINQVAGTTTTGSVNGINADNYGGSLTINALGTTIGNGGSGITATNNAGTSDLNITANIVTGNTDGIRALNFGTGATSITTTGAVTGTAGSGIYARNNTGTSLSITAQSTVTGGTNGIRARNQGAGALTITANADVTGMAGNGINAFNSYESGLLTIDAQGAVSGDSHGISALNFGSEALSITSQAVTGAAFNGIDALNFGTSLSINAQGAVSGGRYGINACNTGTALSINAQGVVSSGLHGIRALNYGTSLSINAQGAVSGGFSGITALNEGIGALSITSQAVTGTAGYGIYAQNTPAGTSLTIDVQGAVSGSIVGILAVNYGSGPNSITAQAAVTGGTGYGIDTLTGAGGNTNITLNSGAAVSSTAGLGISNDAGNSAIVVNAGASVAGVINLGLGSDDLTFLGGDFSGVTRFDGGDDISFADGFIDTLSFTGSSGALTGANVVNWENVLIGAGSTLSFTDNQLTAGGLTISSGGTLNAVNGALVLTSDLINRGVINAQNGSAADSVNVSGNFTGGGQVLLDVNFATNTADTLVVEGNVTGGVTTIAVNDVGGVATGIDVLVVSVAGTVGAGDFTLAAPITSGAFIYNLGQIGNDFFLQTGLASATPSFEVMPQVLLGLNALTTLRERMPERAAAVDGGVVSRSIGGTAPRQISPIWGRIEGSTANMDANTTTTGSSYDLNQWKARAGIDMIVQDGDMGTMLVGLNGFYGQADADITSATGKGSVNTDGFGIGLTATWFGTTGYYIDAQAQYSWFSSDLSDPVSGVLAKNNNGTGQAVSLEIGKQLSLNNGWSVTPQAQLSYANVDFDTFTSGATVVSLKDGESVKGRLGLDVAQEGAVNMATSGSSKVYGLATCITSSQAKAGLMSRAPISATALIGCLVKLALVALITGPENTRYSVKYPPPPASRALAMIPSSKAPLA